MDQELKDYLDRQQAYLEREFAEAREFREETNRQFAKMNGQFAEINGQFVEVNGQFAEMKGRIDALEEKLSDEIHLTRVLVEKLDDKVDLVAEGVQNNTEVMHRLFEENQRELREHKAVIEPAHRHLEQRVSRHDAEIAALRRRAS